MHSPGPLFSIFMQYNTTLHGCNLLCFKLDIPGRGLLFLIIMEAKKNIRIQEV